MTEEASKPVKYPPGQHPNSLKNLKPYKPGENGHGRVYPLKLRLQHALDKPIVKPREDAPAGEHIVYATLQGALKREPTPFKEVWDRIEGKLQDTTVKLEDHRQQINIIVSDERAKQLIEGAESYILPPGTPGDGH